MKKYLSLSIPEPCSEKWVNFTPTEAGAYCKSCCKEVIDFTAMSDEAILQYFSSKPQHVCGRLRSDQLKTYSLAARPLLNPGIRLFKAGLVCALTLGLTGAVFAQQKSDTQEIVKSTSKREKQNLTKNEEFILKGNVLDKDDNSPLPGINIHLRGTTYGTFTDAEGYFEFPVPLKAGDILEFSFIGYKTEEVKVKEDQGQSLLTMQLEMEMDIMGSIAINEVYTQKQSVISKWWRKITNIF